MRVGRDWPEWSIEQWNAALLRRYFAAEEGDDDPVEALAVIPDELAEAANATAAAADDVRDAFIRVITRNVQPCDFGERIEQLGADWRPRFPDTPPFVAHLIFSCLVVSEDGAEMGNEGDYRDRIGRMLGKRAVPKDLKILAKRWEQLAKWLSERPNTYRRLVLPSPGGLTQIGYSVRLAFPHRRDSRTLAEVIPPLVSGGRTLGVGDALGAIRRRQGDFSAAFQDQLRDFETARSRRGAVADHPLWRAVRRAASRGTAKPSGVRLLMYFDVEGTMRCFCAAPKDASTPPGIRRSALPQQLTVDHIVLTEFLECDGQRMAAVDWALRGALQVDDISHAVRTGIVFFRPLPDGVNVASGVLLPDSTVSVLVREDRFPIGQTWHRATRLGSGWWACPEVPLDTLTQALGGSQADEETLWSQSMRWSGGVRVEGGWLGDCDLLPQLIAPSSEGASLLNVETGEVIELSRSGDIFRIPRRDMVGRWQATVKPGDRTRDCVFYPAAASQRLKGPPVDRFAEAARSDVVAVGDLESLTGASREPRDFLPWISAGILLGSKLGDLPLWPDTDVDWMRADDGMHFIGHVAGPLSPEPVLVGTRSEARRWRRMFSNGSLAPGMPTALEQSLAVYRRFAANPGDSLEVQPTRKRCHVPCIGAGLRDGSAPCAITILPPDPASDRLLTALAAVMATRSVVGVREALDMFRRVLGIDGSLWDVLRAWCEAGLLTYTVNPKWASAAIVGRPARFVLAQVRNKVQAVLMGLAGPELRERVLRRRCYGSHYMAASYSRWTPHRLVLQDVDPTEIETLTRDEGLEGPLWLRSPVDWLRPIADVASADRDCPTGSASMHWSWADGRFRSDDEAAAVKVTRHMWPNAPDRYAIYVDGAFRWWTYSRNWALLYGYLLRADLPLHRLRPDVLRVRQDAGMYLPIDVGRLVVAMGGVAPGPTEHGYVYSFPSQRLCDFVLATLMRRTDVETPDA